MEESINNTEKFSGKAEIYNKYRNRYSDKCIEDILKSIKINNDTVIADIGAGTGKLTEQFLEKGIKVIAVEPNVDMLDVAKQNLSKYGELIEFKNESAEDTKIEDNSVDIIVVGQAFHWFDKEKFRKECKRILKKNGIIAIMWNFMDYKQELEGKIININKKYTTLSFNATEEKKRDEDIEEFFRKGNYNLKIYENNYIEDYDKFIGVQLSMSYALKKNDNYYNEYIEEFKNLFDEYSKNAMIKVHNNTYCYLGKIAEHNL